MDNSIGDEKTLAGVECAAQEFALKSGEMLGQYCVVRPLGKGGMGEVYEVHHETLDKHYALKLLPESLSRGGKALERFKREARVMAKLDHVNIVDVDDFGESSGRYWLRMELAQGVPLKAVGDQRTEVGQKIVTLADLARVYGEKIPQEMLLPILGQILNGLKYAHEHGVVHRDLKPSNILLQALGNGLDAERGVLDVGCRSPAINNQQLTTGDIVAKIADFGLVKLVGEEWVKSEAALSVSQSIGDMVTGAAASKALLGTYSFMSPEQKRGEEADERSDLYSFGVMTYRLLTGKMLEGRAKAATKLVPELYPAWDEFIDSCLEEDPDLRPVDAEYAATMLNRLMADPEVCFSGTSSAGGLGDLISNWDGQASVSAIPDDDEVSIEIPPLKPKWDHMVFAVVQCFAGWLFAGFIAHKLLDSTFHGKGWDLTQSVWVSMALAGGIGGIITELAFKHFSITTERKSWVTMGWVFAMFVSAMMYLSKNDSLRAVYPFVSGMIGGAACGLMLRGYYASIRGWGILLLALLWGGCFWGGHWVMHLFGMGILLNKGLVIGWGIAGLFGSTAMFTIIMFLSAMDQQKEDAEELREIKANERIVLTRRV